MTKNDGGAAFPSQELAQEYGKSSLWPGMSLRDYFAAKAMHGMLAHDGWQHWGQPEGIAHAAYGFADGMLKERMK